MADQPRVGVEVHALLPHRASGGGDQVRGPITPTPLITRGRERDRDVVAQQVDDVGLGGTGDRNNRGNVFVRVRDVQWALVQASAVGVDNGGCHVEDVTRGGNTARVLIWPTLRVGGKVAPNDSGIIRDNRTVGSLSNEQFRTTLFVRIRRRISLRISRLLRPLFIQSRRTTTTRRLPRRVSIDQFLQISAESVSIPLNTKIRTLCHEILTALTWRCKNVCCHRGACIYTKDKKSCEK